ncbi:MAG TPA: hypothetical protein VGL10_06455, partial [Gammaproteobacteria bacterium]
MSLNPLIAMAAVVLTLHIGTAALAQPTTYVEQQQQLPTIGEPADRYMSPADETRLGSEFLRSAYRSGAILQDPEVSS